jgi:hypothetical protein
MAVQLSIAVRDARLDAIETSIGASAILRIRTGPQPANCATADSGTVLAEMTLPSNWMAAASNGTKTIAGTWSDIAANNTGTAEHFRIYDSLGTTCGIQGSITATGGGGDMTLDNVSIATGQTITITTFTLTDANS